MISIESSNGYLFFGTIVPVFCSQLKYQPPLTLIV